MCIPVSMDKYAPEQPVGACLVHMAQEQKLTACSQCNLDLSSQVDAFFFSTDKEQNARFHAEECS